MVAPLNHGKWQTPFLFILQQKEKERKKKGKGKGREGKGREGKGREGKGREKERQEARQGFQPSKGLLPVLCSGFCLLPQLREGGKLPPGCGEAGVPRACLCPPFGPGQRSRLC